MRRPSTSLRERLRALLRRLPQPLAVALDLAAIDPAEAAEIRGAQIFAIVRLSPIAMAASCLNAVIFIVTCRAAGAFRPALWAWAALVFAAAGYYCRGWLRGRGRAARRPASRRALRRATLGGALFGALWGAVPALFFPGAPPQIQLLIGVLTAGMMSGGAIVLASVPTAGLAYVAPVAAGSAVALVQEDAPAYLGLSALLVSYTVVVAVNVTWSAALFVSSRLAEAKVRSEVIAREQAQARAAHAERMTALGELAGGIAHDFNNVLQAVSGGASLIERHPEAPEYVQRQARRMEAAVERGSAITRRLLAFARRDVLRAEVVDVAGLLREMPELLAPVLGPQIALRAGADGRGLRLLADRRQLESVLVNLATNARDAMPDAGTLTVSAAAEAQAEGPEAHGLKKGGRYVRLTLADTGVGMEAATLARAAEPFFTTKPAGKGTGLGLSIAKGFAEQSGGALAIASAPGEGCAVTLWLPQADAPVLAAGRAAPAVPAAGAPARWVLVVDDDDLVREMLMASLEDAGFAPLGAESAQRALSHLDAGAPVDALITDLSMPGMSGWDLVRQVQQRRRDLPTIMLTGHVGELETELAQSPRSRRFLLLQKPVSPAQLTRRLEALLAPEPA
ncbi:MAG: response regulator [Caulobacteraceae bacterium]|nr:response regulator [Caulobacteraceae bacterium]